MSNEAIPLKTENWLLTYEPDSGYGYVKQVSRHRADDFAAPLLVADIERRLSA